MTGIDTHEQHQWTEAVAAVIRNVQQWAGQQGWSTRLQPVDRTEDRLGTYEVPVLTVETPHGRVILEPVARWASPGEGRIDLYSWPSFNRLMLVRKNGRWALFTEAGVRWPQAWSRATFTDLAANLNRAA